MGKLEEARQIAKARTEAAVAERLAQLRTDTQRAGEGAPSTTTKTPTSVCGIKMPRCSCFAIMSVVAAMVAILIGLTLTGNGLWHKLGFLNITPNGDKYSLVGIVPALVSSAELAKWNYNRDGELYKQLDNITGA